MTKNKFMFYLLPLNNMLIGFSYQKGTLAEDTSTAFEEYSIGIGVATISLVRTCKI